MKVVHNDHDLITLTPSHLYALISLPSLPFTSQVWSVVGPQCREISFYTESQTNSNEKLPVRNMQANVSVFRSFPVDTGHSRASPLPVSLPNLPMVLPSTLLLAFISPFPFSPFFYPGISLSFLLRQA